MLSQAQHEYDKVRQGCGHHVDVVTGPEWIWQGCGHHVDVVTGPEWIWQGCGHHVDVVTGPEWIWQGCGHHVDVVAGPAWVWQGETSQIGLLEPDIVDSGHAIKAVFDCYSHILVNSLQPNDAIWPRTTCSLLFKLGLVPNPMLEGYCFCSKLCFVVVILGVPNDSCRWLNVRLQ